MADGIVIGIAGGTGSGKTTLIKKSKMSFKTMSRYYVTTFIIGPMIHCPMKSGPN